MSFADRRTFRDLRPFPASQLTMNGRPEKNTNHQGFPGSVFPGDRNGLAVPRVLAAAGSVPPRSVRVPVPVRADPSVPGGRGSNAWTVDDDRSTHGRDGHEGHPGERVTQTQGTATGTGGGHGGSGPRTAYGRRQIDQFPPGIQRAGFLLMRTLHFLMIKHAWVATWATLALVTLLLVKGAA